ATVIEGLPAILKNRNAYAIYNSASSPLKLLLRNQALSDDIALRFSQRHWSEWPLTADKYLNWLKALKPNEKVVNLVMDYATIGEHYKEDTGIFDFFKYLFLFLATEKNIKLSTPKEIINYKTPSKLMVKYPVSWAGKQRSISVWEGNQMQQEAFETLYACKNNIGKSKDKLLLRDWTYLQSTDHFYYMDETSEFGNNAISPYNSNYEAFVNYMNVLSDFVMRIETIDNENL